jgi:hypothetical protein
MSSTNSIFINFKLTNSEYEDLNNRFGRLCYKIFSELKRKNSRNNYTEELDDVLQELRISLIHAGCYYKRQIYLEDCFKQCNCYVKDKFLIMVLEELELLWLRRTQHGANKQKFGDHQEAILEMIVKTLPLELHPKKDRNLIIDSDFSTYCKAIAWNCQKNIGKKITRERSIRGNSVSLSQHDFLASTEI